MEVANLPALTNQELPERYLEALAEHLGKGKTPWEIAKQLHPDDRAAQLRTRRKIESSMLGDPRTAQKVANRAIINLMVGLGPASEALVRRAKAGRPDAIKLLFEASGFHNPKSRVEHSGEIKIKLDMPRPTFNEPDGIVDATVVPD